MLTKYRRVILMSIIFLGLVMRLYGINMPLVESHQVRQVQTAMMTRNLYEDHMNIFKTRLDMLGNVPGHIIMEFPLMHAITALLYYLFGVHEIIGRLVNVAFSVGAMFLIYGLARQFLSAAGALAALALYAFSPMNIFFNRAFMPESSMMFFSIGAVYFFLRWLNKQTTVLYLTAITFAAFACLTKPNAALIFAPVFAAWFFKYRYGLFKRFDFWFYMFLAMTPIILWGAYANYSNTKITYPTFFYSASWLQMLRAHGTIIHWFDPKFYVFVGGSVVFLLLTPLGFIGTVAGVLCAGKENRNKILFFWLGAAILYFYLLAAATCSHIYYHLLLLPVAAIFFGFTTEWLLGKYKPIIKIISKRKLIICISILFSLLVLISYAVGYFKYFKYMYSIRAPYVLEVSEIIKKNVPKNRFIIDAGSGLLTGMISYYSHSKSLPYTPSASSVSDIKNLRAKGATTFVVMETAYGNTIPLIKKCKDLWVYLNEKCIPVAVNDHYIIFDLREHIGGGGKWPSQN